MKRALPVLALLLAAAALVVAVISRSGSKPPPNEPSADAEALSSANAEILKLRDELAVLRTNVAELNRALTVAKATLADGRTASPATGPSRGDLAASQAQLAELKESIDQFRGGLVQRGMLPPGSNEVASLRTVVFNPNATPEEKVMALRVLRGANARPDDVVKEMIKAYYATENAFLRADIFRQLDGVTTPELKSPLLEAVSKATDAGTREEAAETLFHYLPDPDVKAWLEHLAANDPNERVRQQATQSIQRFRPRPQ